MEQQQDLLPEIEEVYYEKVSNGVRFVNYLVDLVAFYALFFGVSFLLAAFGILTVERDYYTNEISDGSEGGMYLLAFATFFAYYSICEGVLKGRTLGKLITGCKVVMNDGNPVTFGTAFLRTLCRIVPFEPISAFTGYPWHDRWTNTQVVKVIR